MTTADVGKYTCIATNKFGDSQVTGRLTVRGRTRITAGPRLVLVQPDRVGDNEHHENYQEQQRKNQSGQPPGTGSPSETHGVTDGKNDRVEQVIENTSVWLRCDVNADPMEINHLSMVWKKWVGRDEKVFIWN